MLHEGCDGLPYRLPGSRLELRAFPARRRGKDPPHARHRMSLKRRFVYTPPRDSSNAPVLAIYLLRRYPFVSMPSAEHDSALRALLVSVIGGGSRSPPHFPARWSCYSGHPRPLDGPVRMPPAGRVGSPPDAGGWLRLPALA